MSGRMFALTVGLLAGVLMAAQGSLNTVLGKAVGRSVATLVVQVTGALAAGALVLSGVEKADWPGLGRVPWYVYLGGVIGVAIVFAVVVSMGRLGVATATTAILFGQITAAAIIDHFGLFGIPRVPFSLFKVLGLALFTAGARILLG